MLASFGDFVHFCKSSHALLQVKTKKHALLPGCGQSAGRQTNIGMCNGKLSYYHSSCCGFCFLPCFHCGSLVFASVNCHKLIGFVVRACVLRGRTDNQHAWMATHVPTQVKEKRQSHVNVKAKCVNDREGDKARGGAMSGRGSEASSEDRSLPTVLSSFGNTTPRESFQQHELM